MLYLEVQYYQVQNGYFLQKYNLRQPYENRIFLDKNLVLRTSRI